MGRGARLWIPMVKDKILLSSILRESSLIESAVGSNPTPGTKKSGQDVADGLLPWSFKPMVVGSIPTLPSNKKTLTEERKESKLKEQLGRANKVGWSQRRTVNPLL